MPILIWIILEVLIFIGLASLFGTLAAVLIYVIPMCIGIVLLRKAGIGNPAAMQKMQLKMMSGGNPFNTTMKLMGFVFGGVLLLIPGFITTLIAIFLFLPFSRLMVASWLMKRKMLKSAFSSRMKGHAFGQAFNHFEQQPTPEDKSKTNTNKKTGRIIDADEWKKKS